MIKNSVLALVEEIHMWICHLIRIIVGDNKERDESIPKNWEIGEGDDLIIKHIYLRQCVL